MAATLDLYAVSSNKIFHTGERRSGAPARAAGGVEAISMTMSMSGGSDDMTAKDQPGDGAECGLELGNVNH